MTQENSPVMPEMVTGHPHYRVRLDVFEGPLDLLLYLIKKEELDICNIPIQRITGPYLEYLNLMQMLDIEIAGEFLVMAATLMQIKSRMLLPPDPEGLETQEEDPRSELVRRLIEYKAFKEAAARLASQEARQSGVYGRLTEEPEFESDGFELLDVSIFHLLSAFQKVLQGALPPGFHEVVKDEYTVAEKMHEIFSNLAKHRTVRFSHLFRKAQNKLEAITIFLAVLELVRLKEILIRQDHHFEEIEITKNDQPEEKILTAGEEIAHAE